MMLNRTLVPASTLVIAIGVGGLSVDAGQADSRGRDRNGRASQGQIRERNGVERPSAPQGSGQRDDTQRPSAQQGSGPRGVTPVVPTAPAASIAPVTPVSPVAPANSQRWGATRGANGQSRSAGPAAPPLNRDMSPGGRYENRGQPRTYYDRHNDDRGRHDYRVYGAPWGAPGRPAPHHYYGPGGGFSAYFGWGSGYLYGTTYAGRVYGYAAPPAYGVRVYYGNLRLQVRPRDAAVYVDGYYAGVVDDFDGVFQRLTLEVGPHRIELAVPGLEPQFFDVYVDPAHTVDIRADLFR